MFITSATLHTNLGRVSLYPHFTVEETKAQRPHSQRVVNLNSDLCPSSF